ncbi:MAG: hypothetical protein WB608_14510, partial [Terracidiphilus sp.]
ATVLEGKPIVVLFTLANVGETRGVIVRSLIGVEIVDELTERPFLLGSVESHNELGTIAFEPGEQKILHIPEGKKLRHGSQICLEGIPKVPKAGLKLSIYTGNLFTQTLTE